MIFPQIIYATLLTYSNVPYMFEYVQLFRLLEFTHESALFAVKLNPTHVVYVHKVKLHKQNPTKFTLI